MEGTIQTRKSAKANVTRRINVVKALIKNQSPATDVADAQAKVIEAFDKFKDAQTQVTDLLKEEDKAKAQEYYDKVERAVEEIGETVTKYAPDEEAPLTEDEEEAPSKDAKKTENQDQGGGKDDDDIEIDQSDNVKLSTNVNSSISSARKKSLMAKAKTVKKKRQIELEIKRLRLEEQQLQLEINLAELGNEDGNDVLDAWNVEKELSDDDDDVLTREEQLDGNGSTHSRKTPSSHESNVAIGGDFMQQQQRLIEIMQAPKVELTPFDGDPLKYWSFIRAYEDNVEKVLSDPAARLTRLIQYCTGKAKGVVQSCAIMESNAGYNKARLLLKQRFGNEYIIAKAWIDLITKGQVIKPHQTDILQELSDNLQNCQITLEAMGPEYLLEINSQGNLLKVIERLPMYLKSRWRKEAMDIKMRQHRMPKYHDLVKFVSYATLEATDPVFGNISTPPPAKPIASHNRPSRSNFSTTTNAQDKDVSANSGQSNPRQNQPNRPFKRKCPSCGDDHIIFVCSTFKAMNPKERLKFATDKRLCINCLRPNHKVDECRSERRCEIEGCGEKHTKFLHQISSGSASHNPATSNAGISTFCNGAGVIRVALPIVAVNIKASNGSNIRTYALLDSGSTSSFCTEELLKKLQVPSREETIRLTTLNQKEKVVKTTVASIKVSDINNQNTITLKKVHATPNLPINKENIPKADDVDLFKWPHLKNITIPPADLQQVHLLIGQDSPQALIPSEIKTGNEGEPYATKTLLGWTLNGPLSTGEHTSVTSHFIQMSQHENLEEKLERFWKIESAGGVDEEKAMSLNDKKVISLWQNNIRVVDGHFELPIPFKRDMPLLKNNKDQAERRLQSLQRKLQKDKRLEEKYKDGMSNLLEKGYAKSAVPGDEHRWYLPHHPVFHPHKPEKVRIVFDCAAKYKTSLNEEVHPGPDLTNKLMGVLMRFRQHDIAIIADIQEMFNQVRVTKEDEKYLSFLWWPEGDMSKPPQTHSMQVHLFGGTWSPSCCSFALQQTAIQYGTEFTKEASDVVKHNFYVDDMLKSYASTEEAIKVSNEVKEMLCHGGFRLTKWMSNNKEVLQSFPEEERAKEVKDLQLQELPTQRALGVYWNAATDTFSFNINIQDKPLTKRGILSMVSAVYDPLGFASPFIITAKSILQDLTKKKLGWDEEVPAEDATRWLQWKNDLQKMEQFNIPRCISSNFQDITSIQLHHFGDASEMAYGVASYVRLTNKAGKVRTMLVMAKSRLAPLKKMTIPRLELSAAALAVKQDSMINREMGLEVNIQESYFWTDSSIVLQYIQNEDKRFHTFVANRVQQIHNGSTPDQWRHIPTKMNPADDISRGLSAKALCEDARWINGPAFLQLDPSMWPQTSQEISLSQKDAEVKPYNVKIMSTQVSNVQNPHPINNLIQHYSNWMDLRRGVAWLIAVKGVLSKKTDPISILQADNIRQAELSLIKYIQQQSFPTEMDLLKTGKTQVHKKSSLFPLQPILMHDVICLGTRFSNSQFPDEFKFPAILPRDNPIVQLIIQDAHEANGHSGREYVMATLRQKYWIVGVRSAIRKILTKCVTCKRRDGRPCQPKMADLPLDRVTPGNPPFTHVGVDYFGPFLVKRGRGTEKRYGCIFTCLAIRAVHIEVAASLDTSSFINCLQRFMARRGKPTHIRSDNGTNFVGANRELREEIEKWNSNQIQSYMNKKAINWLWNPPAASHMGGVWERQIRSVRRILAGLANQQQLTDDHLSTLMCIVESIINNRPLTTVSTDPNDLEPLTPNHLLILRSVGDINGDFTEADLFKKQWRKVQYLANLFWKRWVTEYLPRLQHRTKWIDDQRDVADGDLVLIMDKTLPRGSWCMGRVAEAVPGQDGRVRSVKVKTKDGVFMRPVNKVCLLEATQEEETIMKGVVSRGKFVTEE